jgi:hypothetical protein
MLTHNIDNAKVWSVEKITEWRQEGKQTNGVSSYGDVKCVTERTVEQQLNKRTLSVFERTKNYYDKTQFCLQAHINHLNYSAHK